MVGCELTGSDRVRRAMPARAGPARGQRHRSRRPVTPAPPAPRGRSRAPMSFMREHPGLPDVDGPAISAVANRSRRSSPPAPAMSGWSTSRRPGRMRPDQVSAPRVARSRTLAGVWIVGQDLIDPDHDPHPLPEGSQEMNDHQLVERYVRAHTEQDWASVAEMTAPDVLVSYPQSGEVIKGRDRTSPCSPTTRADSTRAISP